MASLSCGAAGSSAPDLLTILTVFRHSRDQYSDSSSLCSPVRGADVHPW